jgi:rhodanese-related sulfurtransferase
MESNHNYPNQVVLNFFKAKAAAYISPMGVKAMLNPGTSDIVLVDVRHPSPDLTWRIPGSLAIPATTMSDHLSDIPKDKLIVLYCWDTWCSLATTAAITLLEHGYRVKELYGGVAAWQSLHLPEEQLVLQANITTKRGSRKIVPPSHGTCN